MSNKNELKLKNFLMDNLEKLPWAAAMADILATSTEAEEETPFPSGTAEETCMIGTCTFSNRH